jgi:signal transduction histidine kinase
VSPELDDRTLRRLVDTGQALVAHLDVDLILDELLGTAAELTGAGYAAIGVLDREGTGLERFLTLGIDADGREAIGDPPRGRGVLGILIDDPRPLRIDDVGEHPRSYGFPAGHPPMRSFLGVPILVRGQAWGNLYLTEKAGGGPFTQQDEEVAITLAAWAAVAVDHARLYAEAERRRAALETAVTRLEATRAIARAIGTETDLHRVLELIVKRARALVDARALVLLLADGDELLVAAGAGQVDSRALGARLPREGTAMGEVLEARLPERVADVPVRLAIGDDALGVVGAETGLLVPLAYRGEGLGVLAAFDRITGSDGFRDDDEQLLEAFAASAATAVATAQRAERHQLRRAIDAAERERRRWAGELHEGTLQGLGALRVLLTTGLRRGDPAALEQAAREAVHEVGEEISRLRRLIIELRPAALDELGLQPAMATLVEHAGELHGLEARLRFDLGDERLGPELETTVYRIVQEAVANALRHARAHRLDVEVRRDDGALVIGVTDDGDGFDPDAPGAGFGLASMRERASLAGGTLEVRTSETGTSVTARFPRAGRSA